ncbi:MAG: deoxyguanosinetriphosphate triphosphohydrolase [Deltaproteobacteria bacterium]|nr:MAG: deoxyguanosinetriphosphate triphosphohydrolase [Deltaproteobacteria bacterium]
MSYERPDLAPYAARSHLSKGRRYPEEFKDERPAFERDRDRIIHSAAFRRLEYKTQVFVIHEGDYYRTRLTHSLEVAQIARGLARMLGLNEELTEAVALAHDLGHTPFGHAGEAALNRLMEQWGGFEHNLQSLRVVEVLEERYPNFPGLNLTFETREGLVKHSAHLHEELSEYEPELAPTLEAQLIELADEIAYNNHDIDDGLESGLIQLEELEEVPLWKEVWELVKGKYPGARLKTLKYSAISHLISLLIHDVASQTLKNIREHGIETLEDVRRYGRHLVCYSPEVERESARLKEFLHRKLYRHFRVERMRLKAERFITELFKAYLENPTLLPEKYQRRMQQELPQRVICDYIAGMTDRFALEEYKKLFDPYERV